MNILQLAKQHDTEAALAATRAVRARKSRNCGSRFDGSGFKTDFMGVHPDQVAEERVRLAKLGVRADVTDSGSYIVYSKREFNKLKQARCEYDRNAGYGDVMPRNK